MIEHYIRRKFAKCKAKRTSTRVNEINIFTKNNGRNGLVRALYEVWMKLIKYKYQYWMMIQIQNLQKVYHFIIEKLSIGIQ